MLKPGDNVLCIVTGVIAGAAALLVCLSVLTEAALTAVVPVGVGVAAQQIAIGIMKRRAWHRTNAQH